MFMDQEKDKVYLFKVLVMEPESEVDLVCRMQLGGDLENAWLMFDHVKCHGYRLSTFFTIIGTIFF